MRSKYHSGFTLIEISIVLVIIGLIVGGVLVGRDMIESARLRAQISQIEKYQTAVNTFKIKYGDLPGDIPGSKASAFGFLARGTARALGDGDGLIQGYCGGAGCFAGFAQSIGENVVFWRDLSQANLIDGNFSTANFSGFPAATTASTTPGLVDYYPVAKINGNYIYVWQGGLSGAYLGPGDGRNYFGISAITGIATSIGWGMDGKPGLSVLQAYSIDTKMDNGLPQSGNVMAWYYNYPLANFRPVWASGGGVEGGNPSINNPTLAVALTSNSCYDNGGAATTALKYSIAQNSGNSMNCAISVRMDQ